MIHLKSIEGTDFLEKRFAILVEPNVAGIVNSDAELNEAIKQNGGAVLCEFGKDYRLGDRKRLTPEEFAGIWMGD